MRYGFFCTLLTLCIQLACAAPSFAREGIDLQTRVRLFSALKVFIARNSSDGAFETRMAHIDGTVEKKTLIALHPVIFRTDTGFMLCADFADKGKPGRSLLDFFLRQRADGTFKVEYVIKGKRSLNVRLFERIF